MFISQGLRPWVANTFSKSMGVPPHISLIFWYFCCNYYWYNKLNCWRLLPFIIVLFSLFVLKTEILNSAEHSDKEQKSCLCLLNFIHHFWQQTLLSSFQTYLQIPLFDYSPVENNKHSKQHRLNT